MMCALRSSRSRRFFSEQFLIVFGVGIYLCKLDRLEKKKKKTS